VAIFQKPLGWVQRYLYNVEAGQIPFPQPVLDVSLDWPLQISRISDNYNTIAGTVNRTVHAPPQEFHSFVLQLSIVGNIPATDVIGLIHIVDGLPIRYSSITGTALTFCPIIGGYMRNATAAAATDGMRPMYVKPGDSIQIEHFSVAGGVAMAANGACLFRLKSYPLQLTG
jgi:hypothetical protein